MDADAVLPIAGVIFEPHTSTKSFWRKPRSSSKARLQFNAINVRNLDPWRPPSWRVDR